MGEGEFVVVASRKVRECRFSIFFFLTMVGFWVFCFQLARIPSADKSCRTKQTSYLGTSVPINCTEYLEYLLISV